MLPLSRFSAIGTRLLAVGAWFWALSPAAAWSVAQSGLLAGRYLVVTAALGPLWVITGLAGLFLRGPKRWAAGVGIALWGALAIHGISTAGGPRPEHGLSLVAANLMLKNPHPDRAVDELLELDADVLVTSETTSAMADRIRNSGRYRVELRGTGQAADVRIWGRGGAEPAGHLQAGAKGFPRLVVGGLEIVGIHATSPAVGGGLAKWRTEYQDLARYTAGRDNLVLAGDFNASLEHRPLRALGLRAASRADGALFPRTWPARFPLIGIDHVLVATAVAVGGHGEFTIPGSDHLGVRATVERADAGR